MFNPSVATSAEVEWLHMAYQVRRDVVTIGDTSVSGQAVDIATQVSSQFVSASANDFCLAWLSAVLSQVRLQVPYVICLPS